MAAVADDRVVLCSRAWAKMREARGHFGTISYAPRSTTSDGDEGGGCEGGGVEDKCNIRCAMNV